MLLSFLNLTFTVGSMKIGLIPDFLGYILILKGIREISEEGIHFSKAELYIKGMIAYTLCAYITDLLGITDQINQVTWIVQGIIFANIALYITYLIIMGIADIESQYKCNLKSETLYLLWKARVVWPVLAYLVVFVPAIALIILVIGFGVNVYFLISFNNSKNLYYEMVSQR